MAEAKVKKVEAYIKILVKPLYIASIAKMALVE